MRWLLRLFLFWFVLTPISLYFGYPILVQKLTDKTIETTHAGCLQQTADQPDMFPPDMPVIAENYCKCLDNGIKLERSDVIDAIKHRPPEKLTLKMDQQVRICGDKLEHPTAQDPQEIHF